LSSELLGPALAAWAHAGDTGPPPDGAPDGSGGEGFGWSIAISHSIQHFYSKNVQVCMQNNSKKKLKALVRTCIAGLAAPERMAGLLPTAAQVNHRTFLAPCIVS